MHRTEIPHNTVEQVAEYLRQALELVEQANVPDDLREAAFTSALNLVSAKQLLVEQAASLPGLPGLRMPH